MSTVRSDRICQVAITLSAVFMFVATLAGFGVIGSRVEQTSAGALAADATLLTPATPAFSLWSLIYFGLFAYVAWQWLPSQAASARARAIGWLAAVSMILNGLWLLVVQFGWLWLSVAVIVALVLDLGLLVQALSRIPASGLLEKVLVDGTFGVYLGWVSVATVANITATLVASGVRPGDLISEMVAVVVLAAAAVIGWLLATRLGGRWAVAAAMVWALGWIAVGRFTGVLESTITGSAAVVAAVAVLAATAAVHLRRPAPVRA